MAISPFTPTELEAMVNETGVDDGSLGSETWLDRLIATAGRDPSWKSSSTLLTLARALSRREALDAMEDDEAMAYCVKLDKLAAMFEPDEGKCGAFTLAGQRCESRARGALTCQNRRHKTQGMWSLARNEDGMRGIHLSLFAMAATRTRTTTPTLVTTWRASHARLASTAHARWI
jgi:hypothetical protein